MDTRNGSNSIPRGVRFGRDTREASGARLPAGHAGYHAAQPVKALVSPAGNPPLNAAGFLQGTGFPLPAPVGGERERAGGWRPRGGLASPLRQGGGRGGGGGGGGREGAGGGEEGGIWTWLLCSWLETFQRLT